MCFDIGHITLRSLAILLILNDQGTQYRWIIKTENVTNGESTKQQMLQNGNITKRRLLQNDECYKKATVTNLKVS